MGAAGKPSPYRCWWWDMWEDHGNRENTWRGRIQRGTDNCLCSFMPPPTLAVYINVSSDLDGLSWKVYFGEKLSSFRDYKGIQRIDILSHGAARRAWTGKQQNHWASPHKIVTISTISSWTPKIVNVTNSAYDQMWLMVPNTASVPELRCWIIARKVFL